MRIMLTVLSEHADRDVLVEGDESTTVARLAEALAGQPPGERSGNVVRLTRSRAPYGLGRAGAGAAPPDLWLDGRVLPADAPVLGLLRDGDLVTLDRRLAVSTFAEEPAGIVEIRVSGGPCAGSVHRLGFGVHTIGSDPACAVALRDPSLPGRAAVVRLTPDAITVEPAAPGTAGPAVPAAGNTRPGAAESAGPGAGGGRRGAGGGRRGAGGATSGAGPETGGARPETGGAGPETGGAGPALDGEPVEEAVDWPEHAVLTCGSSVLTLTAVEPPDAHLDGRPDGGLAYNRPPRIRPPEPARRLEVPVEPRRAEGMRLQLLTAFLPLVLGVGMAWALQIWYFLLFALLSPTIMIGQWWSDRRHGRKRHRQQLKDYRERLAVFETELERARAADEAARRAAAPDPAEVLLTATGPRRRLWERRDHDPDALRLRVGLADLPAALELVPERGAPPDSPLPEPPACRAVPVALAMRRLGVAGLTGPRETVSGLARWLVGQAAALHSPRDLAIVVLSAHGDGEERWNWVRWLPHCAPHGGEDCLALVGADPEAAARRVAELTALIDERLGEGDGPLRSAAPRVPSGWGGLGCDSADPPRYDERPYDVLVLLDGARVLRALPGMPQVLRQGPRAGVHTLALDDEQRLLPEECATVVRAGADGRLRLLGGGMESLGEILADQVPASWCDRLARSLAPIRDVSRDEAGVALPGSARLLDLLGLPSAGPAGSPDPLGGKVLAGRWGRSTEAVIGAGPDGPFSVDLSRDGPHALIAGTTGAGKSELLQTLICSLAAANRPDEMTFVLIDYKGGAAFKECVRLPHTVGMVSDLDGHLTQRALASLAAEIRRRERLLLAAGAKDIEDYHALRDAQTARASRDLLVAGGPSPIGAPAGASAGAPGGAPITPLRGRGGGPLAPLPRLALVIDEFAAMVSELPDFMTGLVDIARRGRSLGIHLILATQRPGGVVTADIQANTSLRIALRVTEAAESTDVIGTPDAAHISKSTPGRCYVRSGTGTPAAVQTARIGGRSPAASEARTRVTEVGWRALGHPPAAPEAGPEGSAATDLSLLVDALVDAARVAGIPEQPSPWLEPLPHLVVVPGPRSTPPYRAGRDEVPPLVFGATDLPWAQDRRALTLDLPHGGHLLVAGTARSGRSTALRTLAGAIAAGASPQDVHVHAIDCGSGALLPLVAMAHCGAVVTRDQLDRVERLLTRLRAEVGRRQQLLAEAGYASLAELRAAGGTPRLPWMVLMLDRWEGFVAAFEGYDYGRLIDSMLQLLREGPAVGLRAVVTGDRSALIGQISTVFDDRLVLRLADPADYGLAGLPVKDLPASLGPGRALSMGEHGLTESQIALLDDDPSGPAQVAVVQSLARTVPARFPGPAGGGPDGIAGDGADRVSGVAGGGAGRSAGGAGEISGRSGAWIWDGEPPLRVDPLPTRITAAQAMELVPSFEPPSPLWALLGVGGDSLAPLGVDLLAQGPGAVIGGPPRSGRSSALLTAARSLLSRGTPVVLVTPRRSPLRTLESTEGVLAVLDGGGDLGQAVAGLERYVVLVDDAELVSVDSPLGTALEQVLRTGRDGEHGLIVAGATGDLTTAYRGFAAEARKSRTGLLLSVQSPADGDLFTVRLPRGAVGGPPGRGLLLTLGTVTPVQTALPG
ncbi:FtsK/SpoIIIE domain-containing protein [Planomonospora parontospora]|uniref:FtsK/SpoIIIE domain-containing protein n=1 Tax=Planomonospora parontospora TaxID=58119 RepID=UPI001983E3DF|nr:FtsK/SpoIIIE domain-containing protein [Planomonospora parontospora]GGL52882.1 cell division protein FtsK [Planomonospora parontospora subsp. antibiotica]GII19477.1 cell division protein FtsK [Planomonospora parontospora subsp. antibiotica]